MENLIYNGALIKESELKLELNNRAFTYGDGLFETIIVKKNKILFAENHFQRLIDGMAALYLQTNENFNFEILKKNILQVAESPQARVKVQVWRKPGGLFTPYDNNFDYIISAVEFKLAPETIDFAAFYEDMRISPSAISEFKTLNALPYILASIQKKKKSIDEFILLDHESNISECCSSNIYFVKDEKLHTPSLNTGCVRGIIRGKIIDYCKDKRLDIIEGKFKKDELLKANYVFTSNVSGISIIRQLDHVKFSDVTPLVDEIKKDLLKELYH